MQQPQVRQSDPETVRNVVQHTGHEKKSPARVNAYGTTNWGGWIRTTDLLISSKAQGWLRSDAVPVFSYENRE